MAGVLAGHTVPPHWEDIVSKNLNRSVTSVTPGTRQANPLNGTGEEKSRLSAEEEPRLLLRHLLGGRRSQRVAHLLVHRQRAVVLPDLDRLAADHA